MRALSACLDRIDYLRGLSAGVDRLIVTLTSVSNGTILWVSPHGLQSVLGYDPEEVVGGPASSMLAGPSETSKFGQALARLGTGETTAGWYDAKHQDGHSVTLRVTAWLVSDDVAVSLAVPENETAMSVSGRRTAEPRR